MKAHTKIELHAFCHPVSSWNLLTEEKQRSSLNLLSNLVYLCLSFWKDPSAGLVEAEVQKGVFPIVNLDDPTLKKLLEEAGLKVK